MNAHVRFGLPRFSSSSGPSDELWTGSVRLVGKSVPDEYRFMKWHVFSRGQVRQLAHPRNSQVILVTSANPKAGKSHVARNLVASLSMDNNTEVTLIDANFENPGLPSANLMGTYHKGLLDILEPDSKVAPSETFLDSNKPNVNLLPCGRPRGNAAELLNSDRMISLLAKLTTGNQNKYVVIDGGPVLVNTDAAMLAQFCGHVLFVAVEKGTRKIEIDQSLARIEQLAWPVDSESVSFVLNRYLT